jgi:hypothetical protein
MNGLSQRDNKSSKGYTKRHRICSKFQLLESGKTKGVFLSFSLAHAKKNYREEQRKCEILTGDSN